MTALDLDLIPAAAPGAVVLLEVLSGIDASSSIGHSADCPPGVALDPDAPLILELSGGVVSSIPELTFAEVPEYEGEVVRVAYGPPGPAGPPGGARPKSPVLTYTGDLLTGIAYADGTSKTLTYDGAARLVQVDYFGPVVNTRTHLAYDAGGRLASVLETVL